MHLQRLLESFLDPAKPRRIRVFISSTFSDMMEERDTLLHKVFPRLQGEFNRDFYTIEPVDLRWGITEEQAHSGRAGQPHQNP